MGYFKIELRGKVITLLPVIAFDYFLLEGPKPAAWYLSVLIFAYGLFMHEVILNRFFPNNSEE
jgi:hypothetical protein